MWAMFLLTESGEVLDMLVEKNDTIKKAVEKLVFVSSEEKTRYEFEQRQKAILDYNSDMDDARQEGVEIGEARGETKKAMDIARNLLDVLDDKIISEKTGVSIESIKMIRENHRV
jgi:predicted transposase/invertase (TIGR01784 family)